MEDFVPLNAKYIIGNIYMCELTAKMCSNQANLLPSHHKSTHDHLYKYPRWAEL